MSATSQRNVPSLITLPPHILTQILTYVRDDIDPDREREPDPPNFPPIQHSLHLGTRLTVPLSPALLPIATASPLLARAAAEVTGAQYTYLTPQTTGYQLHQWVRALAPYVRAVTMDNYVLDWLEYLSDRARDSMYTNLLLESLHLFDALSSHLVRLEVLDLVRLPFHTHHMDDALLTGLYTALESNGATLRELALPAYTKSDICARAMELATLRQLDVFTVDFRHSTKRPSPALCKPILRMLKALDGHADRALGLTKVRDLRLMNDYGALRSTTRSYLSKAFLKSIRVLRLTSVSTPFSGFYPPRFHIFPHLECLYWNDIPQTTAYMTNICTSLQEIHLCDARWFTHPQAGIDRVEDYDILRRGKLRYTLGMYSGNLRTLMTRCLLRPFEVAFLSKSCPNLENLSLLLCSQNVSELRGLLRRCRRMRVLELTLHERPSGGLKQDNWYTIAKAVRASQSLSQFAILVRNHRAEVVTCINAVVNCFVSVVESLGSRARRLEFRVVLNSRKIVPIFDAVSTILNACKSHTSALEFLKVDLFVQKYKLQDPENEERICAQRKLIYAKEDLLRKIRSLRRLDLGLLNKVADHWV